MEEPPIPFRWWKLPFLSGGGSSYSQVVADSSVPAVSPAAVSVGTTNTETIASPPPPPCSSDEPLACTFPRLHPSHSEDSVTRDSSDVSLSVKKNSDGG